MYLSSIVRNYLLLLWWLKVVTSRDSFPDLINCSFERGADCSHQIVDFSNQDLYLHLVDYFLQFVYNLLIRVRSKTTALTFLCSKLFVRQTFIRKVLLLIAKNHLIEGQTVQTADWNTQKPEFSKFVQISKGRFTFKDSENISQIC